MIRRPPISTLLPYSSLFFFFFNDTATTEIYPLSLHDALPISSGPRRWPPSRAHCCSTSPSPAPAARSTRRSTTRSNAITESPAVTPERKNRSLPALELLRAPPHATARAQDRKSTRLNSSHTVI